MSQEHPSYTEDQLEAYVARITSIHLLPDEVQDEALNDLISHYHLAVSNGKLARIEQDLQHASTIISWAMQGQFIDVALAEHCEYFGEVSMRNVVKIAQRLLMRIVDESRPFQSL